VFFKILCFYGTGCFVVYKILDCFFGLSEKESWKERRRKPCAVVVG